MGRGSKPLSEFPLARNTRNPWETKGSLILLIKGWLQRSPQSSGAGRWGCLQGLVVLAGGGLSPFPQPSGSEHRETAFPLGPQRFLPELQGARVSVPGRHCPVLTKGADTHIHRQRCPTRSLITWEHLILNTNPSFTPQPLALEPSPCAPAVEGPTLRCQEPVQGRP